MTTISDAARGLVRRAGLAAIAAMAVTAASHQRAEALSLASPATSPSAKYASEGMTIEVRGHGGRGGGGGFRGGGGFHRGGGMAFRGGGGGGFRAAHVYRGGGGFRAAHIYRGGGFRAAPVYRYGGGYHAYRHAYHRPHFRRHFHHRRHFAPAYYGYYPRYYRPYRVCRVVWTYYGPRRVCRPPYWHRRHHWRVNYW